MDPTRTILSLQPGDVLLGRYTLAERVGRGAMGEVWRTEDQSTGKTFAIKLLPPEFIGSDDADKRMKSEAAIGQDLSHDSIVRLYTYERDPARQNISFLVMEFVEGRTLADILAAEGPQPLDRIIRWANQLAAGIDYAHSKEVLHRDIKPGNIIIESATGRARLLDFGIGREIRNTMSQVSQRTDSSGTPAYMSPQQLMGENHPSNDIYSLAATLYHALAGRTPFTDGHIQTQILHKSASPIHGLPEYVNAALLKGLKKTFAERPPSARVLAESMATPPKPPPPPPPNPPIQPAFKETNSSTSLPRGERARHGWLWLIATVLFLIVVGVFSTVYQAKQHREREDNTRQREAVRHPQVAQQSSPRHLSRKTVEFAPGVTAEFVYIDAPGVSPEGFLMGSPAGEDGRREDETQFRAVLTKGYWMQTTEVTQGQWEAVMGSNPSHFKLGPDYPVETVSWEDCQQFIAQLRQRGIAARLPTEAEWEYACRAGTTTMFYSGNMISRDQANYSPYENNDKGRMRENRGRTTPVGIFAPNPWGLYDMHGNVWEWCLDIYGAYPSGVALDPTGPQTGRYHVFRGGSWACSPASIRSASRHRYFASYRYFDERGGLRLALDSE